MLPNSQVFDTLSNRCICNISCSILYSAFDIHSTTQKSKVKQLRKTHLRENMKLLPFSLQLFFFLGIFHGRLQCAEAKSSAGAAALRAFREMDYRYFVAGGTCAAISHGVTTPIDVVKTRIQANPKVSYARFSECVQLEFISFQFHCRCSIKRIQIVLVQFFTSTVIFFSIVLSLLRCVAVSC